MLLVPSHGHHYVGLCNFVGLCTPNIYFFVCVCVCGVSLPHLNTVITRLQCVCVLDVTYTLLQVLKIIFI